jgi:hypothetical protein
MFRQTYLRLLIGPKTMIKTVINANDIIDITLVGMMLITIPYVCRYRTHQIRSGCFDLTKYVTYIPQTDHCNDLSRLSWYERQSNTATVSVDATTITTNTSVDHSALAPTLLAKPSVTKIIN